MKFVIISRLLKVFIWWQQSDTKKGVLYLQNWEYFSSKHHNNTR